MEELQKMLKQIEDYKVYSDFRAETVAEDMKAQHIYAEGAQDALSVMEKWVKSRISEIYRNSDKRPY